MAKQHFYSRVPATGSLYNRADGFDTFAQSQGLEQEFVQRELSAVYENKLGKRDAEAIRKGTMPAVYSQGCLRSGEFVQSCISYLPKDYTGERSGYLCHSLILSEEEKSSLFYGKNGLLNPEMFVTNADAAQFVDQLADPDYPEKAYVPAKQEDAAPLLKQYDSGVLKGFLFALLSVMCSKGKTVYFRLPFEDHEISQEALRFMNRIVSVVPPQLRERISFVSYVTEPTQYSHIKLKCISERFPSASLSKGIFVDFNGDVLMNMPPEDVVAKAPVSFFYSLLGDTKTREEFFLFLDQALLKMPELGKLTMKILSDLVFLFGGTNGRFDQEKILPEDEDVNSFLATYEKYRDALSEDLRRNAYRCLQRYLREHIAIPKNIFTRISKLYPEELPSLKGLVMDVVLELIHTDVMRDRLFTFLRANYESEDAENRAKISSDLCRVFYGGFLQTVILDFFDQYFAQETPQIREAIFDKLMLAIRSESVQRRILNLLQTHYLVLTEDQKARFYTAAYELMAECNELTSVLVTQLNHQMKLEGEDYQALIARQLTDLLAADYERQEHLLMPLMCAEPGFCRELVQKLVFGPWQDQPIYEEYMTLLSDVEPLEKTRELIAIMNCIPGEATVQTLDSEIGRLYADDEKTTDIYKWFEVEGILFKEMSAVSEYLAQEIREKIIEDAVIYRTDDVFDVSLRVDGPKVLKHYAAENPYLAESAAYATFFDIVRMTDASRAGKAVPVLEELTTLLNRGGDHTRLSTYIDDRLLDWEEQSVNKAVLCCMCSHVLRTGSFLPHELYPKAKHRYARRLPDDILQQMKTKISDEAAYAAGVTILRIVEATCKTDPTLARLIYRDKEGLSTFLWALRQDCGETATDKLIREVLNKAPMQLTTTVKNILKEYKPAPMSLPKLDIKGLFAKIAAFLSGIFKKK